MYSNKTRRKIRCNSNATKSSVLAGSDAFRLLEAPLFLVKFKCRISLISVHCTRLEQEFVNFSLNNFAEFS